MQTKCVYYNVWQSTDSCPAFGHSVVAAGRGGGGGGGWQIEMMIYFGSGDYDDAENENIRRRYRHERVPHSNRIGPLWLEIKTVRRGQNSG